MGWKLWRMRADPELTTSVDSLKIDDVIITQNHFKGNKNKVSFIDFNFYWAVIGLYNNCTLLKGLDGNVDSIWRVKRHWNKIKKNKLLNDRLWVLCILIYTQHILTLIKTYSFLTLFWIKPNKQNT